MHARDTIRAAVQDLLKSIAPIRSNRTVPLQRGDMPCLAVYARSETATVISLNRRQRRELDLIVDGYVRAGDTLDDDLDAMARRIEQAIASQPKLGGAVRAITLASTQIDTVKEGDTSAGVVRLAFVATYETTVGASSP